MSLLTYGAVPLWAGVIITAVASFVLLLVERLGVRHLEALFAVLIGVMAVSFGVMYVLAGVPTENVIEGEPFPLLMRSCVKRYAGMKARNRVGGEDFGRRRFRKLLTECVKC